MTPTRHYLFAVLWSLVWLATTTLLATAQQPHAPTDSLPPPHTLADTLARNPPAPPVKKAKNPRLASWLSIIPGAGQVYNNKAWKVPIIYGAFATTGFLIYDFNNRYRYYRSQYLVAAANDDTYLKNRAQQGMTYYSRYRDVNYLLTALIYVLNIVDASVDAHLSDFDIGDNLAHHIAPTTINLGQTQTLGIAYRLRF